MRTVGTATSTALLARQSLPIRQLFWFVGRNRSTGESESMGLWNGDDSEDIAVIDGLTGATVVRTYHAGGSLLTIDEIPLTSDLTVQRARITLSPISNEVETAFRQYDARLARVDVHRIILDPVSMVSIEAQKPHLFGRIDRAQLRFGKTPNGDASLEVDVATHMREFTRSNPAKKSDETQRLRAGDRFRRYSGTAIAWEIPWGRHKSAAK